MPAMNQAKICPQPTWVHENISAGIRACNSWNPPSLVMPKYRAVRMPRYLMTE
ncbi:Uncharacterised protein [Mycobacterium tuberculosis]|nr:Uncharacterised protein [Mycobacterium tuberculosis]